MIEITNNNKNPQTYEYKDLFVDESFINNQKNTEEILLEIAHKQEDILSNDLLLYIHFLKITKQAEVKDWGEHITLKIKKPKLLGKKITQPSSLSRVRRKLRQDNKIFYDEDTEEQRKYQRKNYERYYGNKQ